MKVITVLLKAITMNKLRKLAIFSVLFAAFALLGQSNSPVQAASGGGCSNTHPAISSCISYSGGYVIADFYMNAYPDSSIAWGCIEIHTTNVGIKYDEECRELNRNGRFGPLTYGVLTLPPPRYTQSAFTKVRIYTHDWRPHFIVDSPRVYYP